jgi:hypothetical protein
MKLIVEIRELFFAFYEGCDFRFFDYIKTQLGLQTGLHFYTQKTSNNNNPNILRYTL